MGSSEQEAKYTEIIRLFAQIHQRFENENAEERQWLIDHCGNPILLDLLQDLSVMTVKTLHVLEAIGRFEPVNGITISAKMGMLKGSVSKITRRLLDKQLIRTEFIPNNKKEILYCTTLLGKELFQLYEDLHQQVEKGVIHFLRKYTESELTFFARVLQDSVNTSWVNFEEEKG